MPPDFIVPLETTVHPAVAQVPPEGAARWALGHPGLTPWQLAQIAADHRSLWVDIAWHRLAYPDLLAWMAHFGDDSVRAAVQQRWHYDAHQAAIAAAVPSLHKDLGKTLWIFIAAVSTFSFLSFGGLVAVTMFSLSEQVVGQMTGWVLAGSALAACCWYAMLRGRRLVTSDITTTIPVAGRGLLLAKLALAVLAIQGVLDIITYLLSLTGIDWTNADQASTNPLIHSVAGLAYITVLGPIIEEVMFRGAILRHLAPHGANFAIITQALLFAIYHQNLIQGLFAFGIGVVLGYVALRFSLKWAIALHIGNNTMIMVFALWPDIGTVGTIVFYVALVAVVVLAVLGRAQYRTLVAEGRSPTIVRPFRTGWSHPLFIVVAVLGVCFCVLGTLGIIMMAGMR